MRTTLPALLSLLALCGLSLDHPAHACSPLPAGWAFDGFGPQDAAGGLVVPPDGPIVIAGQGFFVQDLEAVGAALAVDVRDADDRPVPGRVARLPTSDDFGWYPDAPLAVGARHVIVATHTPTTDEVHWWQDASASFTVVEPPAAARVRFDDVALEAYDGDVLGEDCIGGFDSCDGCSEFNVIGSERRWRFTARYVIEGGLYGRHRGIRSALGADAEEAFAILDRMALSDVFVDEVTLSRSGGAVEAWYGHEACLAVEVYEVGSGVIGREVFCDAVPGAAPGGRSDPLAADDEAGGCAVGGAGGGSGGGALGLLVGLALVARRRRGRGLALGLALGLAALALGCGEVDDTEPPVEPRDMGAGPSDELPPLVSAVEVPPISGGTLAVAAGARVAVVADPDRDRVQLVDLDARRIIATVEASGEPGGWSSTRRGGGRMSRCARAARC